MKALLEFAKRKPILFLILFAGFLRFGSAIVIDAKPSLLDYHEKTVNEGEFVLMARGLIDEGDFTYFRVGVKPIPSAYQPPLYPLLLAGLFKVTTSVLADYLIVQFIQVVLSIWIVVLTFQLARLFIKDSYALLAALIVAVWPAFIYMPMIAHPIVILTPVVLAASILVVQILRGNGGIRPWFWLGMCFAAGVALRSEIVVAELLICLLLFFQLKRQAAAGLAICLMLLLAAEGPWVWRNARSLGKPLLTTTAGLNLFRGDGPTATGGSYQWSGDIVGTTPDIQKELDALPWSRDYEIKMDAIYGNHLKEYLKTDPLNPIKLLPAKAFFFLTTDFTHPRGKNPLYWGTWVILLAPMFYGAYGLWRFRRTSWILHFWVAFYFAIVLAFFSLPRYRLTIEPICAIFAATGIGMWRGKRNGESALVADIEPGTDVSTAVA